MNNVSIVGQLEDTPQLVYNSKDGNKKLYKFVIKVPRTNKSKEGSIVNDYINVKIWSNVLGDEEEYYEQAYVGVEGKLVSFKIADTQNYGNELVATKIVQID